MASASGGGGGGEDGARAGNRLGPAWADAASVGAAVICTGAVRAGSTSYEQLEYKLSC